MSLYATYSKKDPVQPDFDREFRVERENKCFYCGHHLEHDPAIQWLGSTAEIFFHARCVIEFVLRLMRDVHAHETKTGVAVTGGRNI